MALIEARGVSYSYNGKQALSRIDLSIGSGQFVVVLGPNGSGKSTLARLLNAIILPTQGEVSVDGHLTSDKAFVFDIRKTAGLVLQNPDNQIIGDTVEDDIAFALENMGLHPSWIDSIITDVLEQTGLTAQRFSNPRELSGGQKQLLCIAGILAMKGRCIILDEALSMLDRENRNLIVDLLHRLNRENGLTVVMTSQDTEDALNADLVVVLDGGKVIASGKPEDVRIVPESFASSVASMLRERGVSVPDDVITEDGLLKALSKKGAVG